MPNNNQNQMGPPQPNHPHQVVQFHPQNPYLPQGWNNFPNQDQLNQHQGPNLGQFQAQQPGNGMNQQNGGDEEMETSNQFTPPNAMEPYRATPPSRPKKAQPKKIEHPKSKTLNHFQKTRLFMSLERLKPYPNELQMTHMANDMNVEYEAVFEYFEDLKRRNGIPEPSDPFAGIAHSSNESNNNQFIPNPGTQWLPAIDNSAFNPVAAPQPRAQKRASNTAPDFASKFRRHNPEPIE
ncbi:hypothetical protein CAEBREN_25165 [Caenorhabditis brenneri]|uniref:Homeobox domain-containing protein n=1 Tax=Caenorhabditis brenneri TaxID=135651 RepID=G0NC77_CAEBE|nr:hypothetical protein CAEBREN_25165 [Caenorhabditis brenneri]